MKDKNGIGQLLNDAMADSFERLLEKAVVFQNDIIEKAMSGDPWVFDGFGPLIDADIKPVSRFIKREEPKPEKQEEVSPGQYEWILDVNRAAHIAWRGLPPYTADKRRPIDECSTIDTSMVHWVMQSDGTYLTWSAQRLIDMLPERLNYYLENDLRLQHYRHGDVYVVKYENDAKILECRSSNLLDALCKMYDRLLPDSQLKSQIDFGRWQ